MEENIKKMGKNLAKLCNNLESTSFAFSQSLERRPIPLDSASTTFIQTLNNRVTSLSSDLTLLESMSLATVSLEELLGHCSHLYSVNHSHLLDLHSHLVDSGYIAAGDVVDDFMADVDNNACLSPQCNGVDADDSDQHSLFGDSPNFSKLGLSDISLATLASEGSHQHDVLDSPPRLRSLEVPNQDSVTVLDTIDGEMRDEPKLSKPSKQICVSDDDYENLPSHLKSVASWKDLQSAVEKMNSFLLKKGNTDQNTCFHPEDLESMGLGAKGRSYVLLLVRMKRLNVETTNGLISYRVL